MWCVCSQKHGSLDGHAVKSVCSERGFTHVLPVKSASLPPPPPLSAHVPRPTLCPRSPCSVNGSVPVACPLRTLPCIPCTARPQKGLPRSREAAVLYSRFPHGVRHGLPQAQPVPAGRGCAHSLVSGKYACYWYAAVYVRHGIIIEVLRCRRRVLTVRLSIRHHQQKLSDALHCNRPVLTAIRTLHQSRHDLY